MAPEHSGEAQQPDTTPWPALGWQVTFFIGAVSVILGLIVAFRPTASLNVIAVLLGILLLFSGLYHLVEAFAGEEQGRVWRGIAGILFVVAGVVLIRHLDLSVALIGLVIGSIWIVQGVLSLLAGIAAGPGMPGRWWPVVFGAISLVAGIVVVSTPVAAVTTLATLMGIWFVIMGVLEMASAFFVRRAARRAETTQVSVPGQRPGESTAVNREPGGSSAAGRKAQG